MENCFVGVYIKVSHFGKLPFGIWAIRQGLTEIFLRGQGLRDARGRWPSATTSRIGFLATLLLMVKILHHLGL